MTLPVVNLNGTGIEDLIRQHYHVVKAVRKLRDKLSAAAPHGRDYQTQEPNAIYEARKAWNGHAESAFAIQQWAEERLNDLMTQNHERNGDKAYEIVRGILKEEMTAK